jgi:RNA polymerase sigma-70 factor, ECF subfamily
MQADQKKFSKIYDTYVESIYRFIYIKVNSQEIAQDLTSDVFLKVWKSYQKQKLKNPRAFLYTTARHTIIDYYRTNKTTISIDSVIEIEDSSQNIAKTEEISSDIAVIQGKIKNLKEDYQNIVILRYVDDLSIAEISKVLEKSKGATRTLLSRAISELRKQLV